MSTPPDLWLEPIKREWGGYCAWPKPLVHRPDRGVRYVRADCLPKREARLLGLVRDIVDRHESHWFGGGHGDPYNPFHLDIDAMKAAITEYEES